MRLKVFASSVIVAGLLLSGCTTQPEATGTTPSVKVLSEPSLHVKELMEKFKLENVDYAYVKVAIGKGTREGAKEAGAGETGAEKVARKLCTEATRAGEVGSREARTKEV